jgi:hypothetical protein
MKGRDKNKKGAGNEKDSEKSQETREQETNEPIDRPSKMDKSKMKTPPCKKQREMRK